VKKKGNTHGRTWIMARKVKTFKERCKNCMTWSMARYTEKHGK
jgi:hypothetical protein